MLRSKTTTQGHSQGTVGNESNKRKQTNMECVLKGLVANRSVENTRTMGQTTRWFCDIIRRPRQHQKGA